VVSMECSTMDGLDKPDSADIATDCLELLKPYKIAPEYFFVDENKPGQQVSLQLNSEEEFGVAEGQEALDLFELEDDEGLNEMIQTTDSGLTLSKHIDVPYSLETNLGEIILEVDTVPGNSTMNDQSVLLMKEDFSSFSTSPLQSENIGQIGISFLDGKNWRKQNTEGQCSSG